MSGEPGAGLPRLRNEFGIRGADLVTAITEGITAQLRDDGPRAGLQRSCAEFDFCGADW